MKCYKCGSDLSSLDYCNNCGAEVGAYKKIIVMSNTYYNMGLQKAIIRDLSGAAELLRRSVGLYKYNTQARNLLGLVYYEMGEIVNALREWVISKNFDPEQNIADDFIRDVQSNQNRLETLNQSIRKYNVAISYASQGKDDVAIIQLKKVINMNEKFVKGYQLLALLYIKKGEYDKAKKILGKSLNIDKYNTLSIKYLGEIRNLSGATEKEMKKEQAKEKKLEERKALSGNDVIIPKSTYKEINYGFFTFIYVVIGIMIGAAMVFFLVTPARVKDARTEQSSKLKAYMEDISKLNITISDLEKQVENLNTEKESLNTQLLEEQNKTDQSEIYNALLDAVTLYVNGNPTGCADKLTTITVPEGMSAQFTTLYTTLTGLTYPDAATSHINKGSQLANNGSYDEALTELLLGEKMSPEDVSCLYNIGKCYYEKNGSVLEENSKKYFEKVVALAPDSEYAGWSRSKLD
ncbi:MAG: tetratricopeptide repeat protein [Lachnospiraceae bacterium]|nr:tetratricopeptide repeat protein [Lachnospiraceae bacterium]